MREWRRMGRGALEVGKGYRAKIWRKEKGEGVTNGGNGVVETRKLDPSWSGDRQEAWMGNGE